MLLVLFAVTTMKSICICFGLLTLSITAAIILGSFSLMMYVYDTERPCATLGQYNCEDSCRCVYNPKIRECVGSSNNINIVDISSASTKCKIMYSCGYSSLAIISIIAVVAVIWLIIAICVSVYKYSHNKYLEYEQYKNINNMFV
jgi:hypothetical protein